MSQIKIIILPSLVFFYQLILHRFVPNKLDHLHGSLLTSILFQLMVPPQKYKSFLNVCTKSRDLKILLNYNIFSIFLYFINKERYK